MESVKINLKNNCKSAGKYLLTFLKWFALAAVTGAVGGVVGALFHLSVEYVTGVRKAHSWIVFLLPVGGLVIAGLYKLSGKKDIGTNEILDAVRSPQGVPVLLAPLIFVSTVITHLFGGSAGREGAALQMGGTIGYWSSKLFHLDDRDTRTATLCGMAAFFSALFGTPLAATVFAMMVISIGVMYHAAFIPCLTASLVAFGVSLVMGVEPTRFTVNMPALEVGLLLRVAVLAALCTCSAAGGTVRLAKDDVRTALGREIRGAFIAKPGHVLVDADYSQIELRLLAHISGDEAMREAFRSGGDIHTATAAQVFHVAPADVTPEMRRSAKAVNFGIMYGMGEFSLAGDLHISRKQAGEYIENYLCSYPKVREYLHNITEQAKRDLYVKTIFGRRRYIPELASQKHTERAFGERVAMNSPIQGSAADIIKAAMINVSRRLEKEGLDARLLLQVHDGLRIEAHVSCAERAMELLKYEMENAVKLAVPLTVEAGIGKTWYDAK